MQRIHFSERYRCLKWKQSSKIFKYWKQHMRNFRSLNCKTGGNISIFGCQEIANSYIKPEEFPIVGSFLKQTLLSYQCQSLNLRLEIKYLETLKKVSNSQKWVFVRLSCLTFRRKRKTFEQWCVNSLITLRRY